MSTLTRRGVGAVAVAAVFLLAWLLAAIGNPDTYFDPILFGLGTGAIIASLALGLVVAYRASGVINFAHGAIATIVAYIYFGLNTEGRITLPPLPNPIAPIEAIFGVEILDLPTHIDLGGPKNQAVSLAIALVVAALIGLVLHFLVFRPLRYAPVLAKVVASVGLMLLFQAAVVLRFGSNAESVEPIFPNEPVTVLGVTIGQDRFWLLGTVIVISALLWALFRFTKFGISTRAAAENEQFATLLGFNADVQAGVSWVIACVLAGLMGILVAPITGLTPGFFTVLLIASLGAALLGKMSSFAIAAAAGLAMGILDQQVFRLELEWDWLPDIGLRRILPFVLIAAAMVLRGETLPSRGAVAAERMPLAYAPRITPLRQVGYAALIVLAAAITVFAPFAFRGGMQNTFIGVLFALSVVVVTGYVGQISLMQMAIAGFAAFAVASFFTQAGLPLIVAMVLAVACGIGLGMVAALPSLRTRGASLAVITLASGLAISEVFFERPGWFGLDTSSKVIDPPSLFGIEFGPNSQFIVGDDKIPTGGFGVVLLVLTALCCFGVMRLRRSRLGEQMLAVRANERAAAAAGVNVAAVKLSAFAISTALASLGGVMTAFKLQSYTGDSFGIFVSLSVLAFAYLGGVSTVGGAVIAGVMYSEGLAIVASDRWLIDVGAYTAYVAGIFLVATAVLNNEGIDGYLRDQLRTLSNVVRRRRERLTEPDSDTAPTPALEVRADA